MAKKESPSAARTDGVVRKQYKDRLPVKVNEERVDALGRELAQLHREAEVIKEALDARISVDEIAQRLSAHFYAKYQVGLRQAQAKADLERETQRRRQDYLLSSSERTQRTEQGKRLIMRQIIEDDDAKVMALLEDLL